MGFATSQLSDISSPTCDGILTVDENGTSISVTAPKKTIEIHNPTTSGVFVYYGGQGVTSATGIPLVPGETKIFAAVENGFKVYLICAASESANCRVISYKGR